MGRGTIISLVPRRRRWRRRRRRHTWWASIEHASPANISRPAHTPLSCMRQMNHHRSRTNQVTPAHAKHPGWNRAGTLQCACLHTRKAGPLSVARLKMDLPVHDRLAHSRVHRRKCQPSSSWHVGLEVADEQTSRRADEQTSSRRAKRIWTERVTTTTIIKTVWSGGTRRLLHAPLVLGARALRHERVGSEREWVLVPAGNARRIICSPPERARKKSFPRFCSI